jgi:hypothetical protein
MGSISEDRLFVSLPSTGFTSPRLKYKTKKETTITQVVKQAIEASASNPLSFHADDLRALRELFFRPHRGKFSWLQNPFRYAYLHIFQHKLVADLETAIQSSAYVEEKIGEEIEAQQKGISPEEKQQQVRTFKDIIHHILRPKPATGKLSQNKQKLVEEISTLATKKGKSEYQGVIKNLFFKTAKYKEFAQNLPDLVANASTLTTEALPPPANINLEEFCKMGTPTTTNLKDCCTLIQEKIHALPPNLETLLTLATTLGRQQFLLQEMLRSLKQRSPRSEDDLKQMSALRNLLKHINILTAKAILLSKTSQNVPCLHPKGFPKGMTEGKAIQKFLPDLGIPPTSGSSFCCIESTKKEGSGEGKQETLLQMDIPWELPLNTTQTTTTIHLDKNKIVPTPEDSSTAILSAIEFLVRQNSFQEAIHLTRSLALISQWSPIDAPGIKMLLDKLQKTEPATTEVSLLALKLALHYLQFASENPIITADDVKNLRCYKDALQLLTPREQYLANTLLKETLTIQTSPKETATVPSVKEAPKKERHLSSHEQKTLKEFATNFPEQAQKGLKENKALSSYTLIKETARNLVAKRTVHISRHIPAMYKEAFAIISDLSYQSTKLPELQKTISEQRSIAEKRSIEARNDFFSCLVTLPANPPLTNIEEILIYAAQGQLEQILKQRLQGIDIKVIKKFIADIQDSLEEYLQATQNFQQACRVEKGYENLVKASEELFPNQLEALKQQIEQAPSQDKPIKFRIFELFLDVIIRKEQLTNLEALQDPLKSTAVQMLMGQGKTFILLPLLAMLRADGVHISTIMLPKPLTKQVEKQLRPVLGPGFDHLVTQLPIPEGRDFTLADLKQIEVLLGATKKGRGCLLLSPEEKHILINTFTLYLERSKQESAEEKKATIEKLKSLNRILMELSSNESVIGDEVHELLKTNLQYIVALGDPEPFNINEGTLISEITLQAIEEAKKQNIQLDVFETSPTFTQDTYFSQILGNIVNQTIELLKNYTDDKNDPSKKIQAFVKSSAPSIKTYLLAREKSQNDAEVIAAEKVIKENPDCRNLLAGIRFTLQNIIPNAFDGHINQDFGVTDSQKDFIAIPFAGSGAPTETHFSNPYDQIVRTILSYIKLGPPTAAIAKELEKEDSHLKATFGKKITADALKKTLQGTTDFTKDSPLRKFLTTVTLPQITTHKSHIASTPPKLMNSSKAFSGMTGTFVGISSIGFEEPKPDIDTEVRVMMRLFEKEHAEEITTINIPEKPVEKLKKLMKDEKTFALIDRGGWLRHENMNEFAKELLEQRSKIVEVVYHDANGQLVSRNRKGETREFNPKTSTLAPNERITIYEQIYTTGTDIPQADTAHAILTMDKSMILSDFQQALFRMRKIEAKQSCTIVIDKETSTAMKQALGTDQTSLATVFRFLITNQTEKRLSDNYQSVSQRVKATLESHLRNAIQEALLHDRLEEVEQLAKDGDKLLISHEDQSAWDKYGNIPTRIPKSKKIDRDKEYYQQNLSTLSSMLGIQKEIQANLLEQVQKALEGEQKALQEAKANPSEFTQKAWKEAQKALEEAQTTWKEANANPSKFAQMALQKAIADCYKNIDVDEMLLDNDLSFQAGNAVRVLAEQNLEKAEQSTQPVQQAVQPKILVSRDRIKENLFQIKQALKGCHDVTATPGTFAANIATALNNRKNEISTTVDRITQQLDTAKEMAKQDESAFFVQSQMLHSEAQKVKENYTHYNDIKTTAQKANKICLEAQGIVERFNQLDQLDQQKKQNEFTQFSTALSALKSLISVDIGSIAANKVQEHTKAIETALTNLSPLLKSVDEYTKDRKDVDQYRLSDIKHLKTLQIVYNEQISSNSQEIRKQYAKDHRQNILDLENLIDQTQSSMNVAFQQYNDAFMHGHELPESVKKAFETLKTDFQKAVDIFKTTQDPSGITDLESRLKTIHEETTQKFTAFQKIVEKSKETATAISQTADLPKISWVQARLSKLKSDFLQNDHNVTSLQALQNDVATLRETAKKFAVFQETSLALKSSIEGLPNPQQTFTQIQTRMKSELQQINDTIEAGTDSSKIEKRLQNLERLLSAVQDLQKTLEIAQIVLKGAQSPTDKARQKSGADVLQQKVNATTKFFTELTTTKTLDSCLQEIESQQKVLQLKADQVEKKVKAITSQKAVELCKDMQKLQGKIKEQARRLHKEVEAKPVLNRLDFVLSNIQPVAIIRSAFTYNKTSEEFLRKLEKESRQIQTDVKGKSQLIQQIYDQSPLFQTPEQDPTIDTFRVALRAKRLALRTTQRSIDTTVKNTPIEAQQKAETTLLEAQGFSKNCQLYDQAKKEVETARELGKKCDQLSASFANLLDEDKAAQRELFTKFTSLKEQLQKQTNNEQKTEDIGTFLKQLQEAKKAIETVIPTLSSYIADRAAVKTLLIPGNLIYAQRLQKAFNELAQKSTPSERTNLSAQKDTILRVEKDSHDLVDMFQDSIHNLQIPETNHPLSKRIETTKAAFANVTQKLTTTTTSIAFDSVVEEGMNLLAIMDNIGYATQGYSFLQNQVEDIRKQHPNSRRIQNLSATCMQSLQLLVPENLAQKENEIEELQQTVKDIALLDEDIKTLKTEVEHSCLSQSSKKSLLEHIQKLSDELPESNYSIDFMDTMRKEISNVFDNLKEIESQVKTSKQNMKDSREFCVLNIEDEMLVLDQRYATRKEQFQKKISDAEKVRAPTNFDPQEFRTFSQNLKKLSTDLRNETSLYSQDTTHLGHVLHAERKASLSEIRDRILFTQGQLGQKAEDATLAKLSLILNQDNELELRSSFLEVKAEAEKHLADLEQKLVSQKQLNATRKGMAITTPHTYLATARNYFNTSLLKMESSDVKTFLSTRAKICKIDSDASNIQARIQTCLTDFDSRFKKLDSFEKQFLIATQARETLAAQVQRTQTIIESLQNESSLEKASQKIQEAQQIATSLERNHREIAEQIASLNKVDMTLKKQNFSAQEFEATCAILMAYNRTVPISTLLGENIVGDDIKRFLYRGIYLHGITPTSNELAAALYGKDKYAQQPVLNGCVESWQFHLKDKLEKYSNDLLSELTSLQVSTPEALKAKSADIQSRLKQYAISIEKQFQSAMPQALLPKIQEPLSDAFAKNLLDIVQEKTVLSVIPVLEKTFEGMHKSKNKNEIETFSKTLLNLQSVYKDKRASASAQHFGRAEQACDNVIKSIEQLIQQSKDLKEKIQKDSSWNKMKEMAIKISWTALPQAILGALLIPTPLIGIGTYLLSNFVSSTAAILTEAPINKICGMVPEKARPTVLAGLQAAVYVSSCSLYTTFCQEFVNRKILDITETIKWTKASTTQTATTTPSTPSSSKPSATQTTKAPTSRAVVTPQDITNPTSSSPPTFSTTPASTSSSQTTPTPTNPTSSSLPIAATLLASTHVATNTLQTTAATASQISSTMTSHPQEMIQTAKKGLATFLEFFKTIHTDLFYMQ